MLGLRCHSHSQYFFFSKDEHFGNQDKQVNKQHYCLHGGTIHFFDPFSSNACPALRASGGLEPVPAVVAKLMVHNSLLVPEVLKGEALTSCIRSEWDRQVASSLRGWHIKTNMYLHILTCRQLGDTNQLNCLKKTN